MKYRFMRFICGYVTFEACGDFPERFINLAQHSGLSMWDIESCGSVISAKIIANRYKKLHGISRKTSMRTRIKAKSGLPFLLLPHRKRSGFALGAMLFFLIIWAMSNFIWVIEYPEVPPELDSRIRSAAHDIGIHPGARRSELDGEALGSLLELSVDELSWASVNIFGSNLSINVREYDTFVNDIPSHSPCNIVAEKGGIIVKTDVLEGQAAVCEGDTVDEGELLISGVVEDDEGEVRMVHAQGNVIARTDHRFTQSVELNCCDALPTGRIVSVRKLTFFGVELPLYIGKLPEGIFDKERTEKAITIGNITLPLTMINEKWTEMKTMNHHITKEEAYKRALAVIEKGIAQLGDITIVHRSEYVDYTKENVCVTVDLTIDENIACERAIIFD